MAVKIRFSTEIKTVPFFIHTGMYSNTNTDEDIKKFIKGELYKHYVTDAFMDRKKMEVMSTDITEIGNNKFKAVLTITGCEPLEAVIEYFKYNDSNQ